MTTGADSTTSLVLDLAPTLPPALASGHDPRLLFDGFLQHPTQSAAALLLLGQVARQRFYLPPGVVAALIASDPVVTTSHDRLRFESFSACCGVALRYDVMPNGLDGPPVRHGTTNIDLTGPTRVALAGVQGIDPLHVRVTDDMDQAVTFTTLDHTATEEKAPLPARWVRGFAEAQAAGAGLTRRAHVTVAEARRFWRTLPRTGNGSSSLFASPTGRGIHLTGTPTSTTVPVGGPSRLRIIEPLLRYADAVTVYGPQDGTRPGPSLWQLDLPDGTLSCALSPTASRGFSGEGGLLHQLADPTSSASAATIADHLAETSDGRPLHPDDLAEHLDLTPTQVRSGLAHLAASGKLGYDSAESSYFHRELPWTVDGATVLNPRLAAARRLVDNGTITVAADGETVDVRHGSSHHRVRGRGRTATCTCPWIARHGTTRGPCKHILAADLARDESTDRPGSVPT